MNWKCKCKILVGCLEGNEIEYLELQCREGFLEGNEQILKKNSWKFKNLDTKEESIKSKKDICNPYHVDGLVSKIHRKVIARPLCHVGGF